MTSSKMADSKRGKHAVTVSHSRRYFVNADVWAGGFSQVLCSQGGLYLRERKIMFYMLGNTNFQQCDCHLGFEAVGKSPCTSEFECCNDYSLFQSSCAIRETHPHSNRLMPILQ